MLVSCLSSSASVNRRPVARSLFASLAAPSGSGASDEPSDITEPVGFSNNQLSLEPVGPVG